MGLNGSGSKDSIIQTGRAQWQMKREALTDGCLSHRLKRINKDDTNFKKCLIRMIMGDQRTTTSWLHQGNTQSSSKNRDKKKKHEIKTHAVKMFPLNQSASVCVCWFLMGQGDICFDLVSKQHLYCNAWTWGRSRENTRETKCKVQRWIFL